LIFIVVLKSIIGIFSIPAGFVGGALVHLILLILLWSHTGIRIVWHSRFDKKLRQSLMLALPLILGTAALQFGVVVSRFLAAQLSEGNVSALDYATRISSGVVELLTSGILVVTLVDWSAIMAQGNQELLRAKLQSTLIVLLLVIAPVVAVLVV